MKSKILPKSILAGLLLTCFIVLQVKADRVYILPGIGYNQADINIVNAIIANGHTVVSGSSSSTSLPVGFTSTAVDPVNGYDWLCLFGEVDYTSLITQVKSFIDIGGKVLYQHEVTCCVTSTTSAAAFAASFTGLPIVPNSNPYIAFGNGLPGWIALVDSCVTMIGSAYKGMDGAPLANQLQATGDLNGGTPSYTVCPNFGIFFSTTDFTGTAHKGAFVALGDVNLWFDGGEPGAAPVNMHVINYFFPNDTSTCFLFPPGTVGTVGINSLATDAQLINIYFNPMNEQIEINSDLKSPINISVFNSIGQQIYYSKPVASKNYIVKTTAFRSGFYFVKIVNDEKTIMKKILIN